VAGVATLAAAGIGAPVAALVTNQPIGYKMLDEAIVTFSSVAIAEGVVEWRKYAHQQPQPTELELPPWAREMNRGSEAARLDQDHRGVLGFVEPPEPSESESVPVGADAIKIAVGERGPLSLEEEEENERIIREYKRSQRSENRGSPSSRDRRGPDEIPGPHNTWPPSF